MDYQRTSQKPLLHNQSTKIEYWSHLTQLISVLSLALHQKYNWIIILQKRYDALGLEVPNNSCNLFLIEICFFSFNIKESWNWLTSTTKPQVFQKRSRSSAISYLYTTLMDSH